MVISGSQWEGPGCGRTVMNSTPPSQVPRVWLVRDPGSVQIERGAQNPDGEMRQVLRIIVELNPSNDAVLLHVLRHLGFVDAEMLGQLLFQSDIGEPTASADALAPSRASCKVSQPN